MKLQIHYDPYLKKEAQVVQDIIKRVFGFESSIDQKIREDFLVLDEELGIYKIRFPNNVLNTVYITGNQIASNSAKSAYDFVFGKASPKNRVMEIFN